MTPPPAQAAPALFPTGLVLGRFRVDGVLGIGGTGTVFRAHDEESGDAVAVKAIPHDAVLRQRARREVAVASRLSHPNVVRLREVLEDDEYVYVISELVDGGDLQSALRQQTLPDEALLRVAAAVCDALAHAHANGVVHRDVKPANVLLGRDGTVRLADFGIAAIADPDATVDDRLLGTLSYMAPEACRGDSPAAPADVWAAGVMVYECLTGANPFRARSPAELADRHGTRARPLDQVRPDLPRSLSGVCARALSASPRRRPTAAALRDALRAAADRLDSAKAPSAQVVPIRPLLDEPTQAAVRLPAAIASGVAGAVQSGLAAAGRVVGEGHVPAPLVRRAESVALRLGPALCAGLGAAAVTTAMPFWPRSFVAPLVVLCSLAALVSPWVGAALVAALAVPVVGNLSSGLAWALGLGLAAWLLLAVGAGRRALLPILAPPLTALLAWPAYLALAGRCRSAPARALAGAAGAAAVALWAAGASAAAGLHGVADARTAAATALHGAGAPLAGQAAVWAAAAVAWPWIWRAPRRFRPLALAGWLAFACLGQGLVPALLGRASEPAWATISAVWIVGIVAFLTADLRRPGPAEPGA